MLRTFKFRIYPSNALEAKMLQTLETCRTLYNDALAERKDTWEKQKKPVTYTNQQNQLPAKKKEQPEITGVHSQVLQNVLRRVDRSFKNFFRRVKLGEKPGYPRFKGEDRYDSFTYSQFGNGVKLTGKNLWLSQLGNVPIKLHRQLPDAAVLKTCTIKRDVDRWHACITAELPDAVVQRELKKAVGIDVGLTELLTLNTGEKISNPHWLKGSEETLVREQRLLSRKKRGSKNRAKQRLKVARIHRKIRDQRRDFAHKLSRQLVDNYDLIVFEDLNVQQMMQNNFLSKFIGDAAWFQLMNFTSYKAEEAGVLVEFVSPENTTQNCSSCGQKVPKSLKERMHTCPFCGLSLERDLNAARNVLSRSKFTVGPTGSACGGLQKQVIEAGSPHLPI